MFSAADVTWRGPVTDPSGTATGARALIRGLRAESSSVRLRPIAVAGRVACRPEPLSALLELALHEPDECDPSRPVIHRGPIPIMDPYAQGRVRVAMTALPTVVPSGWVERLSMMDAVWVPAHHQLAVLERRGVPRSRLAVIPEAVDLDHFSPDAVPLDIPEVHGTVFLAPGEWDADREWPTLLDAWCRAFSADDDVTLVLAVWSRLDLTEDEMQAEIVECIVAAGHDPSRMADAVILGRDLMEDELPSLYAASHVVCAPSRAIGTGRVAIEALACGRPVIAPTWEGDPLLDGGVGWPAAGVDAVVNAMRDAHRSPDGVAMRGENGPGRAARHCHRAVARLVRERLAAVTPRLGRDSPRPSLVIEGAISGPSSLAGINRALARALFRDGRVDVGVVDIGRRASTDEMDPAAASVGGLLAAYPDVTIHHAHPPTFAARAPGRSVQIAHWEYGPPPDDWANCVPARADEVWASSNWVRDWYVRGGMDPERVVVVPLGVDPARFHPAATPMDLGDAAPGYRFLFVGALAWRKGADLIASAFGDAFTAHDDVTLVIKTYGSGGPYVSDGCDLLVERLRDLPGGPRLHILTDDMDDADMPGLYTACDCLVHPYRGEAFGMTMLEAMACGLPVVMPDMGAARDFADESTALLVKSRTRVIPSLDATGQRMTEYPVVIEVDSDDLAARLREVYESPDIARSVGAAAARHVAAGWTWDHVVDRVIERFEVLSGRGVASWR